MARNTRRTRSTISKSSSRKSSSGSTRNQRGRSSAGTRGSSRSNSSITTGHDQIREWTEGRGGHPACVKGTGGKSDTGMIRLEFPGAPGSREESLQEIG